MNIYVIIIYSQCKYYHPSESCVKPWRTNLFQLSLIFVSKQPINKMLICSDQQTKAYIITVFDAISISTLFFWYKIRGKLVWPIQTNMDETFTWIDLTWNMMIKKQFSQSQVFTILQLRDSPKIKFLITWQICSVVSSLVELAASLCFAN